MNWDNGILRRIKLLNETINNKKKSVKQALSKNFTQK